MSKKIVLVAETGSDIPRQMAEENGIYLVPMHVAIGDETLDDGTFPAEDVCAYYNKTGKVPKTSGSTPGDFTKIFDEIHGADPEIQILHLAYSAITTCSYASAVIAAENRSNITSFDTKQVSVGQGVCVLTVAKYLQDHPEAELEEVLAFAKKTAEDVRMCFIPKNLDYLRAGGRVSNVVALTGNLLGLHPCIEIIDGQLLAKKKYRGSLLKVVPKVIEEYAAAQQLLKDQLWLIETPYMDPEIKVLAESTAKDLGFKEIHWLRTGCVITTHGGPGAFGVVGFKGN